MEEEENKKNETSAAETENTEVQAYVPPLQQMQADTQSKTCGIVWKINFAESSDEEA
ncbi:hypothetical protein [Rhodoflexus sp.]